MIYCSLNVSLLLICGSLMRAFITSMFLLQPFITSMFLLQPFITSMFLLQPFITSMLLLQPFITSMLLLQLSISSHIDFLCFSFSMLCVTVHVCLHSVFDYLGNKRFNLIDYELIFLCAVIRNAAGSSRHDDSGS